MCTCQSCSKPDGSPKKPGICCLDVFLNIIPGVATLICSLSLIGTLFIVCKYICLKNDKTESNGKVAVELAKTIPYQSGIILGSIVVLNWRHKRGEIENQGKSNNQQE